MGDSGGIALSGVIFLFSSTCHHTETHTGCATRTLGRSVVYLTYSQAVWAHGIACWDGVKGNCISWYAEVRGTERGRGSENRSLSAKEINQTSECPEA